MAKKEKTVQDIQDDILIREVNEDVYYEKLKQNYHRFKYPVLVLIILVIGFTIGIQLYANHKYQTDLTASDAYENALILNAQGKSNEALIALGTLKNSKTDYKYLSQMQIANIYIQTNRKSEAALLLNDLRLEKDLPESLRPTVEIAWATANIDSNDMEKVQSVLSKYLTFGNPFYVSAVAVSAFVLDYNNQKTDAQNLIKKALDENITEEEKVYLTQILTGIN